MSRAGRRLGQRLRVRNPRPAPGPSARQVVEVVKSYFIKCSLKESARSSQRWTGSWRRRPRRRGLTTRDWPDRFVPTLDVDIYHEETVVRDSWPTRAATWREPGQLCESNHEVFHNGTEPAEVG